MSEKVFRYKVSFDGSKIFYRIYEFRRDMTLFSLHKFLDGDLGFAPDQMIAFKGIKDEDTISLYGLFDLGSGTLDGVTLQATLDKGESTLLYVFDLAKSKYLRLTFEGNDEWLARKTYPNLLEEQGKIPNQFSSNKHIDFLSIDEQEHFDMDSQEDAEEEDDGEE